ncbi:MAG: InlB B-repeat-containing protein [Bacillota bacterium]|nr:InlB B-repeat-containing protein [Bacillota bacterium]
MTVSKATRSAALQAAADALNAEAEDVKAVDISFSLDGIEIEPAKAVRVTISTENVPEGVQVVHVDDQNNAEIVNSVKVDNETVQFQADAFSIYAWVEAELTTVNFSYNGSVVNTQVVKVDKGETLYDPSSEVELPAGTLFKGWKIGTDTTVYTIEQLNAKLADYQGQTITVVAETYKAYSVTYKAEGMTLKVDTEELVGSQTSVSYEVNQEYEVASSSQQFMGWMVEGTDTVYTNGQTITLNKNLVLVAKVAEGYWLTFNEVQKGATYNAPVFVENGTNPTKPADPTCKGYTFSGWYKDEACTKAYNFNTQLNETTVKDAPHADEKHPETVVGSITLYAKWRKAPTATSTINVIYDAVEGTDAPTDATPYKLGDVVTAQTGAKAPAGKVFDKWTIVSETGTVIKTVKAGETFTIDASIVQKEDDAYFVQLVAVYADKTTTSLNYDANGGGEFLAGTQTGFPELPLNSKMTLLSGDVIDAKAGYVFLGWSQDADATEPEFTAGQEVGVDNLDPNENVLYAVWKKVFYVYHSSDNTVETVDLVDSYNIAAATKAKTLYGGYYSDYAGKGAYAGDGKEVAGTPYTGQAGAWDASKAYSTKGTAMAPEAGVTYFLKEVPNSYLLSTHIEVSEKTTSQLYDAYLTTTIDDANYQNVGFGVSNVDSAFDNLSKTITIKHGVNSTAASMTFGVSDVSHNTTGYIASLTYVTKTSGTGTAATYKLLSGSTLVRDDEAVKCYWITLDGVKVWGAGTRSFTITDKDADGIIEVKTEDGTRQEVLFDDIRVKSVLE